MNFFASLFALKLSATKSEIKKKKKKNSADVHWNVWKSIKILYVQNYIFEKKDFKWEISNHLNFGPNFIFGNCFMVF